MRLKLKAILFEVDFRCSEHTNYERFKASERFPGYLRSGEVILFVSRSGNQLVWVLNYSAKEADVQGITDSRRWRLHSGSWSPMMLANYANEVGIELIGVKQFAALYEEDRKRKRAHEAFRRRERGVAA